MKVYLCGPINGCTDAECKDWRAAAKAALPDTLDPMRRDYRGREAGLQAEIVEADKADITQCDALLVNYDRPSVGTSMEILFAWERGLLVVTVAAPGTVLSPWLVYHSSVVVPTFAAAFELLNSYAKFGEVHYKAMMRRQPPRLPCVDKRDKVALRQLLDQLRDRFLSDKKKAKGRYNGFPHYHQSLADTEAQVEALERLLS